MKLFSAVVVTTVLFASSARADLYMQNPRGSNDRNTSSSSSGSSAVDAVVAWIASIL